MDKIDEKIKYIFLPPPFLVKGFIGGASAPSCNYEEYLTELINKSTYFNQRTNNKTIKLIEKQDCGQPDICENGFSLDYKLIGGESAIAAQRLTSESITHISNGVVSYGLACGRQKGYEAVRIHLALRDYSCDELIELDHQFRNDNIVQRDVAHLLNNLRTDKNLLLFLPYALMVDEEDEDKSKEIVNCALEDCFHSALGYRKLMLPEKETFLCCIHNQQMLFFMFKDEKLSLVDEVYTYHSKTFCKLAQYYDLKPTIIDAIIGKNHL